MSICNYCKQACKIPYKDTCERFRKKEHEHTTGGGRCAKCKEPTASKCSGVWMCWSCYMGLNNERN